VTSRILPWGNPFERPVSVIAKGTTSTGKSHLRRMGTSLDLIDRTYGHLAPDAGAVELALLNMKKERLGVVWPLRAATRFARILVNPC